MASFFPNQLVTGALQVDSAGWHSVTYKTVPVVNGLWPRADLVTQDFYIRSLYAKLRVFTLEKLN